MISRLRAIRVKIKHPKDPEDLLKSMMILFQLSKIWDSQEVYHLIGQEGHVARLEFTAESSSSI